MTPDLRYLQTPIPFGLALAFALTTALTLAIWLWAVRQAAPKRVALVGTILVGWLGLLSGLAAGNFFLDVRAIPPRLPLILLPPLAAIAGLWLTRSGRRFLDALPLAPITYLHTVRIPVELVLLGLYTCHQLPVEMTFEGRNFDILAGLTAPLVGYFLARNPVANRRWLVGWNLLCLLLLANIVLTAIVAAPGPQQQLAFGQPNVAVLKWPLVWLPGFVVPVVLLSHLAALRQLLRSRATNPNTAT